MPLNASILCLRVLVDIRRCERAEFHRPLARLITAGPTQAHLTFPPSVLARTGVMIPSLESLETRALQSVIQGPPVPAPPPTGTMPPVIVHPPTMPPVQPPQGSAGGGQNG